MIGSLRGRLLDKLPPTLLIDVAGVGYEVDAPMSTCFTLPEVGSEVFIYTHMVVREDAQLLYGFASLHERSLFRNLIKTNGVGPKLALTILSSLDTDAFVQCVMNHDVDSLVRVPGIGKKTAERLIIEMRDRLESMYEASSGLPDSASTMARLSDPRSDALSALIALGYKPQQAHKALSNLDESVVSSEEMIKVALKNLM